MRKRPSALAALVTLAGVPDALPDASAATVGDQMFYHYYADNGASLLGVNRPGYDAAGRPYVY